MHRSLAGLALVLATAAPAAAKPMLPRPFERRVDDADVVVIARLKTTPALAGDVFEAEVDEVMKGKLGDGPLRVRAHVPDDGCIPPPPGAKPPPSAEGRAGGDKLALFLDAPVDGVRLSRDPLILVPAATVSSWYLDRHPATAARETIRALVKLDSEDDPARAADLWVEGIPEPERSKPLLTACLLTRVEAAARDAETARAILGDRLAARAVREFAVARPRLLAAIARHSQSLAGVRAARACVPPRSEAERAVFDEIAVSAATVAFHDNPDLALETLRLWYELERDTAEALATVLRNWKRPATAIAPIAEATRNYVRAHPSRERAIVEAVLGLLDDSDASLTAETLLASLSGQGLRGADAWRAWWKKRSAAK